MAIAIDTLTDGGQRPADVARGIAGFLSQARRSLDIALYDVRFETDAGALVLASLLGAVQRGVEVRLLYSRVGRLDELDGRLVVASGERHRHPRVAGDRLRVHARVRSALGTG